MNPFASSSAAGPSRLPSTRQGGAQAEWPSPSSALLFFLDPHSTSREKEKLQLLIPKEFITTSLSSSTHILLDPSLNFNVLVSDYHRAAGRTVVSFTWAMVSWFKGLSQLEEPYFLRADDPAEEEGREMVVEHAEERVPKPEVENAVPVGKEERLAKAEILQDREEPPVSPAAAPRRGSPPRESQEPHPFPVDKGKRRAGREPSVDVDEEAMISQHLDKKPRPSPPSSPSVSSSSRPTSRRKSSRPSAMSSRQPDSEDEDEALGDDEKEEDELLDDVELGEEEPLGEERSWINGSMAEARALLVDDRVFDVAGASAFKFNQKKVNKLAWTKEETFRIIHFTARLPEGGKEELVWHGVHVALPHRSMAAVDLRWRKLGGHTGTSASKSVFLDLAVKRYRELNPTLVPLVDPFCYAPWSATEEGIVDEILAPRKKNMEVGPYVQRVVWKLEHKRNMTDAWRFVEKRIKVLFDETTESRAEAKKGKA